MLTICLFTILHASILKVAEDLSLYKKNIIIVVRNGFYLINSLTNIHQLITTLPTTDFEVELSRDWRRPCQELAQDMLNLAFN